MRQTEAYHKNGVVLHGYIKVINLIKKKLAKIKQSTWIQSCGQNIEFIFS